uniref:DUF1421 domain-containing protein n=1 Tax=Fagus sylvatica TaxID=28930 RepID=A0A2N9FIP9_FAGSY
MNTTPYMDKQIMDLSLSPTQQEQESKDFIDLINQQHANDNINKEEIVPSYDFQPIRPWISSSDSTTTTTATPIRNYGSVDSTEPAKVIPEKDRNFIDPTIVSEIDQTMKKHADNLLHVLEGVSARLTQLESRTRNLENSVDGLKVSVENNHGSTDGKMRQLENILREVQSGVQDLKDKQIIVDAQLQMAKLHISKVDQQSETQNTVQVDSVQQAASAPQQSHQQLHPPVNIPQSLPALPPPNAPPQPSPQQMLPPSVQLPPQFLQNQIPSIPQREPYFPPPGPAPEAPNQQYQSSLSQQSHPPSAAPPHQQFQQLPQPQYSQPPSQPPQQHPSLAPVNPTQLQPSLGHHAEEAPYAPQTYPPSFRQPPTGPPSPQQFYGAPSHMYEPTPNRPSSGFSSGYGPPSGPSESYQYGGSSQFGGTTAVKPQLSSAVAQSGGSGYPQLPTARVLPQALPTASGVGGGGSGSTGSGNRVPIDDVIDKVTNMGFPRDHVRATVRKLTENGQSVDLNIVLDKLMNDGEVQPPRGWFGR